MIIGFKDDAGIAWEAWEAHPCLLERRTLRERRVMMRDSPDRRVHALPGYQRGWLVFRSPNGRRRLRAIPDGWSALNEKGLRALLAKAARPSGALRWNAACAYLASIIALRRNIPIQHHWKMCWQAGAGW